jgi:hypothetical protein
MKKVTEERLDQGHLHPLLEVPRQIQYVPAGNQTRASAVGREHSNKELSNSLLIDIRNIYMNSRQYSTLVFKHVKQYGLSLYS